MEALCFILGVFGAALFLFGVVPFLGKEYRESAVFFSLGGFLFAIALGVSVINKSYELEKAKALYESNIGMNVHIVDTLNINGVKYTKVK